MGTQSVLSDTFIDYTNYFGVDYKIYISQVVFKQGRVLFNVKTPFFSCFHLKIGLKSDLNFNIFEFKEPKIFF